MCLPAWGTSKPSHRPTPFQLDCATPYLSSTSSFSETEKRLDELDGMDARMSYNDLRRPSARARHGRCGRRWGSLDG